MLIKKFHAEVPRCCAQLQLVNSDSNFMHAHILRILIKAWVQSGISWLAARVQHQGKLVCMELLHYKANNLGQN